MNLEELDWFIIFIYLILLLSLSAFLSRFQKTKNDYFVSNRNENTLGLAISVMATQCSTNSILGAPAFVAFSAGGGLIWLQYELAIPLSMIIIMFFLFPVFYRIRLISVYEYLEKRFDRKTRLILSTLFQLVRVCASAVVVYGVAKIIQLITGLSFFWSVIILGAITIVYDILGGIKAIVYSDIIQMVILVSILVGVLIYLSQLLGGFINMIETFPDERTNTLDFSHHGLGDGKDFSFWPMFFGGFFLYISYYGCDQSQIQRELCAKSQLSGQNILFINGLLRFPLVLLYCFIGIGLGAYAQIDQNFLTSLPLIHNEPNYNLAVPFFIIQNLPSGFVGLTLVALFAAAMSSLDSVFNSLSAVTMEDFLESSSKRNNWTEKKKIFISRLATFLWGILSLILAFHVESISPNVLVAINKIGSLINGPVLGVFLLGLFSKKTTGTGVCVGLLIGFFGNIFTWVYLPNVSWLWWNVIGLILTILSSNLFSRRLKDSSNITHMWSLNIIKEEGFNHIWIKKYCILLAWFVSIFFLLLYLNYV